MEANSTSDFNKYRDRLDLLIEGFAENNKEAQAWTYKIFKEVFKCNEIPCMEALLKIEI